MIIILEGQQKTGKSTLAKFLVENLKFKYYDPDFGFVINPGQDDDELYRLWSEATIQSTTTMLSYLPKNTFNKQPLIIDRFHLTEAVYGLVKRKYPTGEFFSKIDTMLSGCTVPVKLIYCYDDLENLKTRNNDPHLLELDTVFNLAFGMSGLEKIKVVTKDQKQDIMKFIDDVPCNFDKEWNDLFNLKEKVIV